MDNPTAKADVCPIHAKTSRTEKDVLNFTLLPTVQHMAAVKIASLQWTTRHIRDEAAALFEPLQMISHSNFMLLFHKVEKQICKISLPDTLISHLTYVVSRLGLEIFQWMISQIKFDFFFNPWIYLDCIQFTSRGRINRGKTAQLIISKDGVSENYKINASRFYCFNLEGEDLLNQVIENCDKDQFFEEYLDDVDRIHMKMVREAQSGCLQDEAYSCMSAEPPDKKRRTTQGPSFMILSSYCDEIVLMKLWDTLSEETKANILDNYHWFMSRNVDSLCIFISQMDKVNQKKFLKHQALYVLVSLFNDWLWQECFIETFIETFRTMTSSSVCFLINEMAFKVMGDLHNSKSKNILVKTLQLIPPYFNFCMENEGHAMFNEALICLFNENNTDIIKLLFSLIPTPQKRYFQIDDLVYSVTHKRDDKISLLHLAVNQYFETPKEIEEHFLKRDSYFESLKNLINIGHIQRLKYFISIFLFKRTTIDALKARIAKEYLTKLHLRLFLHKKNGYEVLEEFLSFCFSENEKVIQEFKATQILGPSADELPLIIKDRGDNVAEAMEDLLRFCFGQEGSTEGKEHLLQDRQLMANMCKGFKRLREEELMEEFLQWSFASDEDGLGVFKEEWIV